MMFYNNNGGSRYLVAKGFSAARISRIMSAPPFLSTGRRRQRQLSVMLSAARKKKSAEDGGGDDDGYHLVIVESPTKVSTLSKILNDAKRRTPSSPSRYEVAACLGHIRNLPKKKSEMEAVMKDSMNKDDSMTTTTTTTAATNRSFPYSVPGVDLEGGEYRPIYTTIPRQVETIRKLQKLASRASKVCLATDPDREGEAIAWHLTQVLNRKDKSSPGYYRWRLSEITASAVAAELERTKEDEQHRDRDGISRALVEAQETRRVLDRLVGFTVSPALWRKLAVPLSAGRVQSVALALIVQRERERLRFEKTGYCTLLAQLLEDQREQGGGRLLTANLISVNEQAVASTGRDFASTGRCLADKSSHKLHLKEPDAQVLVDEFLSKQGSTWKVVEVESRRVTRQPPQAFRTSTLQQEGNRRLGWSVQLCMQVAQQLYQAGYISYMRTDATVLSQDAIAAIHAQVSEQFGKEYINKATKEKKAIKYAQEAHEAIRPAVQEHGGFATPNEVSGSVSSAALELYRLIYLRSLACQMAPQISNSTRFVMNVDATRSFLNSVSSYIVIFCFFLCFETES